MSADNFIAIFKGVDGRYRGYMGFASDRMYADDDEQYLAHLQTGRACFDVATAEEANNAADGEYLEYGHFFHEPASAKENA
jgi:hypothetical protein